MPLSKLEFDQVRDAGFASQGELDAVEDAALHWQGTWVSQNYILNDIVFYPVTGSLYVCKLATTASQVPTDATYWTHMEQKDNLIATTNPTINDDSTLGYSIGSIWVNTVGKSSYFCVDATATEAKWNKTGGGAVGAALTSAFTSASGAYVNVQAQTSWMTVGSIIFPGTDQVGEPSEVHINARKANGGGANFDIRVYDATNANQVAIATNISSTDILNIIDLGSLGNFQTGTAIYEVQVIKNGGGGNPTVEISALTLEL